MIRAVFLHAESILILYFSLRYLSAALNESACSTSGCLGIRIAALTRP